jgi:hypothetical protein
MAEGRWINVPGKGRRWQMPSGEIRFMPPTNSALDFIGDAFNALGSAYQANRNWVNEHNERVRRQQAASPQPLQTMMGSAYTKPATPTVDPLALRKQYMATVEGPVRDIDMDAPVPGVTGDAVYDGQKYSYLDPLAPTPALVTGLDSSGAVDRRQSDDYKAARAQYETTPAGQYQRYFKSPEFDYVFGSGARGEGAPKDAAAMEALGNQLTADPESRNIASMYAAQSAMGRINQDAIQKMYEGDKNMQAWAKENPMLAQREYLKSQERQAASMPLAPDQENVMGDSGSRVQGEGGYDYEAYMAERARREQSPIPLVQQEMQQQDIPDQAENVRTAGMNAVDRVNEFVKRFKTPPQKLF